MFSGGLLSVSAPCVMFTVCESNGARLVSSLVFYIFMFILMEDLLRLFPRGGSIQLLNSGAVLIHYGTDGAVIVNPDGFISGDRYAIKKLAFVFKKKDIAFVTLGNGLLLSPVPCSVSS